MLGWLGVIVIGAVLAVLLGQFHESGKTRKTVDKLYECAPQTTSDVVDFDSLSDLPPPVVRYFRLVLTDGQKSIRTARLKQSGVLRINTKSDTWSSFTADQVIVPSAIGFVWNAKVATPFATHVRVLDSYINSVGAGRVSLLSAFPLATAAGEPKLNSRALHRWAGTKTILYNSYAKGRSMMCSISSSAKPLTKPEVITY